MNATHEPMTRERALLRLRVVQARMEGSADAFESAGRETDAATHRTAAEAVELVLREHAVMAAVIVAARDTLGDLDRPLGDRVDEAFEVLDALIKKDGR